VALARGRWDEAEAEAREAKRRLQEINRPLEAAIAIVRAEALTGAGHAAEALRVLDEIAPMLDRSRREPLKIRARACRLKAQTLVAGVYKPLHSGIFLRTRNARY
jgi:ATP/maltotriose-dependent transcriptional regulator MalT